MTETNVWDWNKMLRMTDYHKLAIARWPGWDKVDRDEPPTVKMSCVVGEGESSRQIAIRFDDIADGSFYYRDYTQSGIPIVRDGERYGSTFIFQFVSDYEKFCEMIAKPPRGDECTD